jgi:hypothetical protein
VSGKAKTTWAVAILAPLLVAAIMAAARHEVEQDERGVRRDSTITAHEYRLRQAEQAIGRLDTSLVLMRRTFKAVCFRNPSPECER